MATDDTLLHVGKPRVTRGERTTFVLLTLVLRLTLQADY